MDHDHAGHDTPPGFWSSRYAVGLIVLGGIAAYFLLTEHLAHVVGALPYLFLLACPLMHVFMHGGHGGHGHHHRGPDADAGSQNPPKPGGPS
ncbi:MAG: DUF2933 domain-containing protein [Rhodoferax sp.]|nr:MAG: DUF2933 domain-containing protein [Rhodoferax sp.]